MPTTEADAKELVRAFTEELNAGNYDAVEAFFADGYNDRYDNDDTVNDILEREREREQAFPDKREEIDVIMTDTDHDDGVHLDAWYMVTGTHEGAILNIPPTGNQVQFPLFRILVIEDGRITRYRQSYTIGFLLDLGLDWEALTHEVDVRQFLTSPEAAGSARAD